MKRYKLKKDLPTFKAGDKFYLDHNNDLYLSGSNIMAYHHTTLEKFPNILTDWFEEISETPKRPRAEYGKAYSYVSSSGRIVTDNDYRNFADNYRYDSGNYSITKGDSEAYKEYLIARQMLLDDAKGGRFTPDGNNYVGSLLLRHVGQHFCV